MCDQGDQRGVAETGGQTGEGLQREERALRGNECGRDVHDTDVRERRRQAAQPADRDPGDRGAAQQRQVVSGFLQNAVPGAQIGGESPFLREHADFSRYPRWVGAAVAGAFSEPEQNFEFGLQRILDGLEAVIRTRSDYTPDNADLEDFGPSSEREGP